LAAATVATARVTCRKRNRYSQASFSRSFLTSADLDHHMLINTFTFQTLLNIDVAPVLETFS